MSSILYYSNFCENCKPLLISLSQTPKKDDIHFICLDKRVKKPNGTTNVVLSDGQEILLPPSVTKVPALLLLNRGNRVIFGKEIDDYLEIRTSKEKLMATNNNGEPIAFAVGNSGNFGVASDTYSFLDQSADELSAKGDGGMRQQHHYASIHEGIAIETPPDNYTPDKIGSVSMEKLQLERNTDIKMK